MGSRPLARRAAPGCGTQDAALRYLRGRAHYELGHWSSGDRPHRRHRSGNRWAGGLVSRGWAYAYLNQTDQALADFARALKQKPNDPAVLLARYFVHSRRGEWNLANADRFAALKTAGQLGSYIAPAAAGTPRSTAYTRAIEGGQTDWWVWLGRAALLGTRTLERGRRRLRRGPRTQARRLALCGTAARCCTVAFGQHDKAIADGTRALELKKDHPVLWLNRGRTITPPCASGTKPSPTTRKPWNCSPTIQVPASRANAYANLEQWDQAAADYARVVEQGAANPEIWHLLALLRLQLGDRAGYRAVCADLMRRFGRSERRIRQYVSPGPVRWAPDALIPGTRPASPSAVNATEHISSCRA